MFSQESCLSWESLQQEPSPSLGGLENCLPGPLYFMVLKYWGSLSASLTVPSGLGNKAHGKHGI